MLKEFNPEKELLTGIEKMKSILKSKPREGKIELSDQEKGKMREYLFFLEILLNKSGEKDWVIDYKKRVASSRSYLELGVFHEEILKTFYGLLNCLRDYILSRKK